MQKENDLGKFYYVIGASKDVPKYFADIVHEAFVSTHTCRYPIGFSNTKQYWITLEYGTFLQEDLIGIDRPVF